MRLLAIHLLLFLSGCSSLQVSDLCDTQLTLWADSVAQTRANIRGAALELQQPSQAAGRSLASASDPSAERPRLSQRQIPDDVRNQWQLWAEGKLQETQRYWEAAHNSPRDRAGSSTLSELARQWVVFHGYAAVGDTAEMELSLDRIDALSDKVGLTFCHNVR